MGLSFPREEKEGSEAGERGQEGDEGVEGGGVPKESLDTDSLVNQRPERARG